VQNKALLEKLEQNIGKLGNSNADMVIAKQVMTLIG
jgi:UDP-N-acetylglucosamine--N-acetylmuramyl-(pentapeptide) pyrophosphoryl-undecaprenol N-acetylglucosamine transferase